MSFAKAIIIAAPPTLKKAEESIPDFQKPAEAFATFFKIKTLKKTERRQSFLTQRNENA